MTVDVPQIKSKWVGESEKNLKALFERYREAVNRCVVAPILFFNEADAIIGKRKSGAEYAVDKMENTLQNIRRWRTLTASSSPQPTSRVILTAHSSAASSTKSSSRRPMPQYVPRFGKR